MFSDIFAKIYKKPQMLSPFAVKCLLCREETYQVQILFLDVFVTDKLCNNLKLPLVLLSNLSVFSLFLPDWSGDGLQ